MEARVPVDELLQVSNLVKHFPSGRRRAVVHAVNDVSFAVRSGETLGIVGESGSGKTTLGRTIIRLTAPTDGGIVFAGNDISRYSERACRRLRARMQMVFQDPWSALNPQMKVSTLIEEPLKLHTRMSRAERAERVLELARQTQLPKESLDRTPRGLSGGQLQRVCIARAIATAPDFVVFDEPTSSLDLSVRAGILRLLDELRERTGLTSVFISHDLGTVRLVSDRILVMYLGSVVEQGLADEIFSRPQHPYTRALISAYLDPDPRKRGNREILQGEIPSPINLPDGCAFATRCPMAIEECHRGRPSLRAVGPEGHEAACIRSADLPPRR